MIERMTDCGPPITMEDVASLEKRLNVQLPEGYRNFLVRYNGGRPHPDGFPIEGLKNNPFGSNNLFLQIGGPIESCNLGWHRSILEQLPSELFPIANNGCGDLICIILPGGKVGPVGSVVFWDYHAAWGQPGLCYKIYPIAKSFEAFIECLQVIPASQSEF